MRREYNYHEHNELIQLTIVGRDECKYMPRWEGIAIKKDTLFVLFLSFHLLFA